MNLNIGRSLGMSSSSSNVGYSKLAKSNCGSSEVGLFTSTKIFGRVGGWAIKLDFAKFGTEGCQHEKSWGKKQ